MTLEEVALVVAAAAVVVANVELSRSRRRCRALEAQLLNATCRIFDLTAGPGSLERQMAVADARLEELKWVRATMAGQADAQ